MGTDMQNFSFPSLSAARLPRTLTLALALAALSGGCTLAPRYERPAAPVASAFPTGEAYGAKAAGNPAQTAAADLGWRDFLGDPQLQKLVELALRNNRDLRVAVLNVQASRAQYRIERAALFPTVSAKGTQTDSRSPLDLSSTPSGYLNYYNVGLSAQWELDLFGKLQSLKNQALYQYLATAQARKAAQMLLVSEVANQYLTLRAADEQLKVTAETLATAQESYRLAKLQFDTGTGSELDLRQAETVIDQAQANYQAQIRSRAQAENQLVLLVGQPLPANLPAPLPLDDQHILADIPAGLPSDLLTRRPDIVEAEDTLRAANANIGAARAAFFPDITLTATGGSESPTLGGLFKAGTAAWTFAPDITLPIFNAGSNFANLDAAQVQKNIAVAQYEKAIQTAFQEVADGLAARGTYDAQINALERDTYATQRTLDLSTLRYRNGVDSYLSVLTAQTSLYSAQQTLISARLDRLTNLVNLYQYLGGGWIEHTGDTPRQADDTAQYPAPGSTSGHTTTPTRNLD
jgi:multidrug efflux system outer membrane protein